LPQAIDRAIGNICIELPFLISEIMQDIIRSMTENGRTRINFREQLKDSLDSEIIECAISTAEDVILTMEDHYINRSFANYNRTRYGYDSDDSDVGSDGSIS
jgi:hypothetical protein